MQTVPVQETKTKTKNNQSKWVNVSLCVIPADSHPGPYTNSSIPQSQLLLLRSATNLGVQSPSMEKEEKKWRKEKKRKKKEKQKQTKKKIKNNIIFFFFFFLRIREMYGHPNKSLVRNKLSPKSKQILAWPPPPPPPTHTHTKELALQCWRKQ